MKNQPEAPEAPDYAAANEAGVQADINALPLRNAINAASTLGTAYTDPNTGKTYDFTGLGSQDIGHAQLMQQLKDAPDAAAALLKIQQDYGPEFAKAARASLEATDPTGFAMRDEFGSALRNGTNSNESLVKDLAPPPSYEQYGASNPGKPGVANYEAYVRNNPDLLANWENNESKNPGQTLANYGKQHYDAAGKAEGRQLQMDGYVAPTAANNGPELARLGDGPELARLGAAANMQGVSGTKLADTGATAAGRSALEQQIFDRLAMAGQSDPSLDRAAQQAARARGAASGNLYGDGSAMNEALAVQAAQRDLDAGRRNDALTFLGSGQSTSDTRNRLQQEQLQSDLASTGFNNAAAQQNFNNQGLQAQFNNDAAQRAFQNQAAKIDQNNVASNQAFQNAMTAIGQRNQALQNSFAAQQSVAQQQLAARQQDTANKQSYLGLQPIVAQGSMLSGLQQGAAPTTSGTGYNAVGTAQNAGALGSAFAGNVFGTQANIFGTQSQAATAGNAQMAGLATSFLCHVARQVYGPENGRWVVFYYWKELIAPKWFRAFYNRVAPEVAILIRPFPLVQSVIRSWMDRKIQIA